MAKGIQRIIDKKGNPQIMVRFKHLSKTYPVKNFTKLFGITSIPKAETKLSSIKNDLSEGKNPFVQRNDLTLDEIFKSKIERKRKDTSKDGWSEFTISNYELFYEKVMKKELGNKYLKQITYSDLKSILESEKVIVKGIVWKNRLKQILNPIFDDALKLKQVNENPCDKIGNFEANESDDIYDVIVNEDLLFVINELYKAVPFYPTKTKSQAPQVHAYLYLLILTSRRIGEPLKLIGEDIDIDEMKIISPKEINKTGFASEYPIPKECLEYFKTIKDNELVFPNIKRASVYLMFQRLLSFTKIKTRRNKNLSPHDLRSLMVNTMIKKAKIDSLLADSTLDHVIKGTKKHYVKFKYSDRKEAFKTYWQYVRNEEFIKEKQEFKKKFYKNFEEEFEKAWKEEIKTFK